MKDAYEHLKWMTSQSEHLFGGVEAQPILIIPNWPRARVTGDTDTPS